MAMTVTSADVGGALAEAWQAFSDVAHDDPRGWDLATAAAEVQSTGAARKVIKPPEQVVEPPISSWIPSRSGPALVIRSDIGRSLSECRSLTASNAPAAGSWKLSRFHVMAVNMDPPVAEATGATASAMRPC
jgi:hypothetical protein